MSFSSGPLNVVLGEPLTEQNPAYGSGSLFSPAVVIKNMSPYLLQIGSGSGETVGLVDPFTTDMVPLDADSGQQIIITPVDLGLGSATSVAPFLYLTWFTSAETPTGNYPFALPFTSITNSFSSPIPVVTVGALAYASLTGPGETATPGDLTQAGGFTVDDSAGHGITLSSTGGNIVLGLFPSGTNTIFAYANNFTGSFGNVFGVTAADGIRLTGSGADGVTITASAADIDIFPEGDFNAVSTGAGIMTISSGALPTRIVVDGSADSIRLDATTIGVFNAAPALQQASGGTLAGVIAGLVALGWFSS